MPAYIVVADGVCIGVLLAPEFGVSLVEFTDTINMSDGFVSVPSRGPCWAAGGGERTLQHCACDAHSEFTNVAK